MVDLWFAITINIINKPSRWDRLNRHEKMKEVFVLLECYDLNSPFHEGRVCLVQETPDFSEFFKLLKPINCVVYSHDQNGKEQFEYSDQVAKESALFYVRFIGRGTVSYVYRVEKHSIHTPSNQAL